MWRDGLTVTQEFIEKNHVWVAVVEEAIVGFTALSVSGETAELEHLWVLPEHMGKGTGGKLLAHALDFCGKHKISALRIESDPNAQAFYERFGARKIGEVASKPAPRVLPVLLIKSKVLVSGKIPKGMTAVVNSVHPETPNCHAGSIYFDIQEKRIRTQNRVAPNRFLLNDRCDAPFQDGDQKFSVT